MRITTDEIDEIWESISIGEDEIDMHEYAEAIETAVLAKLASTQQEWVDTVMYQAQVFASCWSLVGCLFDKGEMLEDANKAKAELRAMLATKE